MMKKVIDYLLNTNKAEIPKRGRKELKSIIIDNRKFRYNKDKPISNVLTKKLLSVKRTNEYRSYAMKKATVVVNRERVRQLITKHAIRNKFRVRDIHSAFRRYANSIVLENKHFQGERGLEMNVLGLIFSHWRLLQWVSWEIYDSDTVHHLNSSHSFFPFLP